MRFVIACVLVVAVSVAIAIGLGYQQMSEDEKRIDLLEMKIGNESEIRYDEAEMLERRIRALESRIGSDEDDIGTIARVVMKNTKPPSMPHRQTPQVPDRRSWWCSFLGATDAPCYRTEEECAAFAAHSGGECKARDGAWCGGARGDRCFADSQTCSAGAALGQPCKCVSVDWDDRMTCNQ